MPVMTVKRGIWAVALVALAFGIVLVVLPLVASTRIVRDRIAYELTSLTGYKVEVDRGPNIFFWPTVTASFEGFTLSGWNAAATKPVLEADRAEIEMSAWSALAGDIVFSRIRLIRPTLRLTPDGSLLYATSGEGGGRIGYAISAARAALARNASDPDRTGLPADALGVIEFSEGRLVTTASDGDTELVTSIAGWFEWPSLDRPAGLSVRGIWRGESVELSANAARPLILAGGGRSTMEIIVKANPLEARFQGNAGAYGNQFIEGSLTIATPTLRRLLEWSRGPAFSSLPPGAVSLRSSLSGTPERLRLADVELVADDRRGVGALDVSVTTDIPSVSGTLAFGDLDLGMFLSAFTPLRARDGPERTEIEPGSEPALNLDLRISAAQANWGAVRLTELAATAQIKDRLAVLDMSDAAAFGGSTQASLRLDATKPDGTTELRLNAENVDLAAVTQATGFGAVAPEGRATLSLMLKGTGTDWQSFMTSAAGSVSARMGTGRVNGFDLNDFLKKAEAGQFFALNEVADGAIAVESAELKAVVANGSTRIERASAVLPERQIALDGIVSALGRGLALSGTVNPRGGGEAEAKPEPIARFFVGGAMENPIVTPLSFFWNGR